MTNQIQKYQSIIGHINYSAFLIVVALLPFPQIFLRYACVIWLVLWFVEGRFINKPIKQDLRKMLPFILFGIWYLWKIISGLWAENTDAYLWQLERYMAFGLLIPVGIWGVNECYDWKQICKVLVISCIAAVFVYTFTLFWAFNAPVLNYEMGIKPLQQLNFEFFASKISYIKHRLFLCSVEMMGLTALLIIQKDIIARFGKVQGWIIIIFGIASMTALILATGSRASLLSGMALIAISLLYKLPIRRIRYKVGFVLLAGGLSILALSLHPRMEDFNFEQIFKLREIKCENDIRLNIWGVALEHHKDYTTHGVGAGQSFQFLQSKYPKYGLKHYTFFNAHNQYLEECIEIGIPGMLFFILAWISIPYCATGRGRKSAMMLFILFTFNMITDCMFGRFDGIALWCVWMVLIRLQANTESHEQTTRDA